MKLRSVTFAGPIRLPGKDGAERAISYHPDYPQMGGFHLDLDMDKRLVRIAVPEDAQRRGIGQWWNENGQPRHFLGAVCYVPLEQVRAFELEADAEKVREPVKKPEAPKKG